MHKSIAQRSIAAAAATVTSVVLLGSVSLLFSGASAEQVAAQQATPIALTSIPTAVD